MLLNIDPTYTAHNKPHVVYDRSGFDLWSSYFFEESPIFFVSTVRFLDSLSKFIFNFSSVASNFWDIIKDQVHIFPSLYVDFGLVLSQKEIDYYIWNSYSTKTAYVQEPVMVGDFGTTFIFNISGNFTLQPGKGTPGLLTVYTEGPISSYTNFEITVTPSGLSPILYVLETKAERVIAFPLWPDWSKKVEFKLKFNTIISKSTQNFEQRRPLMSKPQRSISFTNVDTTYGLLTNAINFAQSKTVGIPLIHEIFQVTSIDGDRMGVEIRENTGELWNLKRYCNYVLFFDVINKSLVAKKISSLTANHIYVENPILEEFPNEAAVVGFPMLIGVFKSAKPTVLNGDLVSWDLVMDELIGENQPVISGLPTLPAELTNKIDWADKVSFEQNLYRDIGEFAGTAQMVYSKYPLDKNTNKSFTGTFSFKTRAELFSFMDFICGTKGRFKKFEFLVPLNEFQLIRGEYEGVNQIRVKNNYYAEQFSKVLNKKIVLKYRGFSLSTTILASSNNSEYTTLTLGNATNFRIYEEDFCDVRIEQYKTVRMDLDEFTLNCDSGKSFSMNIRMVEVYE